MTKDIIEKLFHILNVSQRMLVRELPLVSAAIRKFNAWIGSVDYRGSRKMEDGERKVYDLEKVKELEREIADIHKGE